MKRGGAGFSACLVLLSTALALRAEPTADALLACSAEFYARAEYNRGLRLTSSGHQKFLMERANLLLQVAQARAPLEVTGCGGNQGPLLGLVICLGPANLFAEQKSLMLDRLTVLVIENGPDHPLPVCMEDEICSECLRLLDDFPTDFARD